MNYQGTYAGKNGKRTLTRFKAGAVCQSQCAHATGDVAVNKKRRDKYKLQTVIIIRHQDHKYKEMSVTDVGNH